METAQSHNAAGMQALAAGDFAAAARQFETACTADPNAVALWRNLAHARRNMGDDDGEGEALDRALAIDRTDLGALLRRAQLHQRLNEEAEAFAAWNGVLQLAARLDNASPQFLAELDAGRAYLSQLRSRLDHVVDSEITPALRQLSASERRRAQAFIDAAAGRRVVYQNQCAGLLYPFLPADEYFDDQHFPWFELLKTKAAEIRAEALALLKSPGEALRPYVRLDPGTPENIWTKLDGQLNWGACFLWEYGEPNTPVLARCPVTAAMLASVPGAKIPGRAPSAFFSILRAGAHIPPHTGVSNTRAIIHLPLVVPAGCRFRVGGETREWVEGQAFAFDDTIEHEAWNESDKDRVILIFDVWNPHLTEAEREIIASYYAAADSTGLAPRRSAS